MGAVRSRFGILALFALCANAAVSVWDWFDRAHRLDPYFGTDKNSAVGHLVRGVFDQGPIVLFAVAVVFGLLYSLEPWTRNRFGGTQNAVAADVAARNNPDEVNDLKQEITAKIDEVYRVNRALEETRAERDALRAHVQDLTRQVEAVQSDWKATLRDVDTRMVTRDIANALAQERDDYRKLLDRLTPLVNLYHWAAAITTRLQSFRDNMEEVEVTGDHEEEARQIARIAAKNRVMFASDFRPDLVRLATDAKQQYGLVYPGLTDDVLARDVGGQQCVDPALQGLHDMTNKIRNMLADEALQINAK